MKPIWFIWHGARDTCLQLRLTLHGPHGSFRKDLIFKPRSDGKVAYQATEPAIVAAILASSMYADQRRIIAETPSDLANAMPRKLPRAPREKVDGPSFEDIAARLPLMPIKVDSDSTYDCFNDPSAPAEEDCRAWNTELGNADPDNQN